MNRQSSPLIFESEAERLLLEKAKANCRLHGVTLTPLRRLVFMLLQRHPQGIKAYDLLEQIRAAKPNAAPPTVYRALKFLVAQGLAHKISCMNLFIACDRGHHEPDEASLFLVCPHCHSVAEFHDTPTSQALHKALVAAGYRPDHSVMEIGAVCPSCNAQDRPRHERPGNPPSHDQPAS